MREGGLDSREEGVNVSWGRGKLIWYEASGNMAVDLTVGGGVVVVVGGGACSAR